MERFQILCVTMHQKDFSKIKEMNIHSDVVFANQCDETRYDTLEFEGHRAEMISTATRGVGINRNLAQSYSSGDICLIADDDLTYHDDVEQVVLGEFAAHPDADVFIFHLDTNDPVRKQNRYAETRKCGPLTRMPWAAFRIAYRRSAIQKANLWFTTLMGGGCLFPSGEDSLWLHEAKRKGLTFYVSKETIGTVSFENSTWFDGHNEKFFFGKGAYIAALHPKQFFFWKWYMLYRYRKAGNLSAAQKLQWIKRGRDGFLHLTPYAEYRKQPEE